MTPPGSAPSKFPTGTRDVIEKPKPSALTSSKISPRGSPDHRTSGHRRHHRKQQTKHATSSKILSRPPSCHRRSGTQPSRLPGSPLSASSDFTERQSLLHDFHASGISQRWSSREKIALNGALGARAFSTAWCITSRGTKSPRARGHSLCHGRGLSSESFQKEFSAKLDR